ncbi:hypothetical protein FHW00_004282 [Ochrobactrum sp. P6BSIII]|nr:hypothetical protein [Ochrobactrum sp. P6BSIII]
MIARDRTNADLTKWSCRTLASVVDWALLDVQDL